MTELYKRIFKCKMKGIHKMDVMTGKCIRCNRQIRLSGGIKTLNRSGRQWTN
jgi:hypothetical protein